MPPNTDSACSPQMWLPPTPQSKLAVLPTSTLPVDHLVLLPPPALPVPNEQTGASFDRTDLQLEVPGYPPECKYGQPETLAPASAVPKRPRRSAAIAAARNLPRQPSPFDLEDDDDDDAVEDDPSPSASPPPASSSRGAGGGGSSKRKVSHSLIERRRREKINDCLATLRETVPSLREEGERKLARAKERGRKRGKSFATHASQAAAAPRTERKLRMILLGAPGAGKGTLSDWLLERYDIDTIVVGQLLRNEIVKGSRLGLEAERTMRAGGLLADEVVLQVVEPALAAMKDKDWILDGFPRKASQAVLLDKLLAQTGDSLNFVGSLKVPDEVIIDRIADRYIHLPSGRTYNLRFNPPKVAGKDDVTGEPLSQRPDDDALVVRKRLEGFHKENDPLLAHYGQN
ncbi:hypothetical protein C6P46_007069 [Rhodotorula mucilaginosa]|uniref:BHLH domain-containing protein n=1 Tax=Rhodotorula mucilaginosa TaxID=5537 RepID=A0A9P6VX27_RHOMI|nr:hypothetical protein C6P46_007069 [Rhodotorula mucilaginosa]